MVQLAHRGPQACLAAAGTGGVIAAGGGARQQQAGTHAAHLWAVVLRPANPNRFLSGWSAPIVDLAWVK